MISKKIKILLLMLGVFIFLIVVIIAGYLLLSNNASTSTNNTSVIQKESSQAPQQKEVEKIIAGTKTVELTGSGFSPQTVTIKVGDRIVWTNTSGKKGSVNSDLYPTNLLWPFLNLGVYDDGSSVSVNFDKIGTYTYHNQLDPSQTGTVIVK